MSGAFTGQPDDSSIAEGDLVKLLGGGPDLTVLRVYQAESDDLPGRRLVDVGWFTTAGEYRTGTLPLKALGPHWSPGGTPPPAVHPGRR